MRVIFSDVETFTEIVHSAVPVAEDFSVPFISPLFSIGTLSNIDGDVSVYVKLQLALVTTELLESCMSFGVITNGPPPGNVQRYPSVVVETAAA